MGIVNKEKIQQKPVQQNSGQKPGYSMADLEKEIESRGKLINQLYAELERISLINKFKRVDYLFEILNHPKRFSDELLTMCAEEIEVFLYPTPEVVVEPNPDVVVDNEEVGETSVEEAVAE